MHVTARHSVAALGLLAAAAVAAAQSPVPPGSPTSPSAANNTRFPQPLYRSDDIARALHLTPAQIERLNAATDRLQARYRTDFDTLGRLPDRDRTTRTTELMNRYATDWTQATGDVFSEQQRARYRQLELQYRGFDAFADADLQAKLNLTEEQRARLRTAAEWSQQQSRTLADRARTAQDRGTSLWTDYRRESADRLNQILTPEQQRIWKEMTGEPHTFTPATGSTANDRPTRQ